MQGRNRDTEGENRHVEWEVNWEMGIDICTAMCKTDSWWEPDV